LPEAVPESWTRKSAWFGVADGSEARAGIGRWVTCYIARGPSSALGGRTPEEVHMACDGINMAA